MGKLALGAATGVGLGRFLGLGREEGEERDYRLGSYFKGRMRGKGAAVEGGRGKKREKEVNKRGDGAHLRDVSHGLVGRARRTRRLLGGLVWLQGRNKKKIHKRRRV